MSVNESYPRLDNESQCAECGEWFPDQKLARIGDDLLCAACKVEKGVAVPIPLAPDTPIFADVRTRQFGDKEHCAYLAAARQVAEKREETTRLTPDTPIYWDAGLPSETVERFGDLMSQDRHTIEWNADAQRWEGGYPF